MYQLLRMLANLTHPCSGDFGYVRQYYCTYRTFPILF
jgi:hypothetical protein